MRNDTKSTIKIELHHVDHTNKLHAALKKIKDLSSQGGDLELYAISNGTPVNLGLIGHDVLITFLGLEYHQR